MNKSIILIFFLLLLSFSNAQFSENNFESSNENSGAENNNANASFTEPLQLSFHFPRTEKSMNI
jgi:hypothetical protein